MSVNSFRTKKFEDFEIVDQGGHTVCHFRIKPSGISWAPKDAKVWLNVRLDKLATFFEEQGTSKKM
jgi:hypothetical protein